jgi:hypothetical protein
VEAARAGGCWYCGTSIDRTRAKYASGLKIGS